MHFWNSAAIFWGIRCILRSHEEAMVGILVHNPSRAPTWQSAHQDVRYEKKAVRWFELQPLSDCCLIRDTMQNCLNDPSQAFKPWQRKKKNACTCFKPVRFGVDSLYYSKRVTMSKHQILLILITKYCELIRFSSSYCHQLVDHLQYFVLLLA